MTLSESADILLNQWMPALREVVVLSAHTEDTAIFDFCITAKPQIRGSMCPRRTAVNLVCLLTRGTKKFKYSTDLTQYILINRPQQVVDLLVQGELLRRKTRQSTMWKSMNLLCKEVLDLNKEGDIKHLVESALQKVPTEQLALLTEGELYQFSLPSAKEKVLKIEDSIGIKKSFNALEAPATGQITGTQGPSLQSTPRFAAANHREISKIADLIKETIMSKPFELIPAIFGRKAEDLTNDQLVEAAQKCKGLRDSLKKEAKESTKVQEMRAELKEARTQILAILDARP